MSIKKELLNELTEGQIRELANTKGVKLSLSKTQEKYYAEWNERDILIDMIGDKEDITLSEIEDFIKTCKGD
jgi:hypothetical protein